jgi:hypothetical protein
MNSASKLPLILSKSDAKDYHYKLVDFYWLAEMGKIMAEVPQIEDFS